MGTDCYLVLELLGFLPKANEQGAYIFALGIWSLGTMMYELWTQQTPFANTNIEPTDSGSSLASGVATGTPEYRVDLKIHSDYCGGSTEFPTEVLQQSQVGKEGMAFVKRLLIANPKD